MSKSTFKILFYLRKNQVNKDGKAGIMVRLSVNGEVSQFSSKLDIEPKLWDVKLGKAVGNALKSRQMNNLLDDIRTSLKNHYREIETLEAYVTAEKVRNAFLGYSVRQTTILELFRSYNEDIRKLVGVGKASATFAKYDRVCRRLEEYIKSQYKMTDISLKEIDYNIVKCGFMLTTMFCCVSCDNKLDIQQVYPFTVETMPVQTKIVKGETAEIRCELKREGLYDGATYTIRFFQSAGKGSLQLDDGTVFKPNDRYSLDKGVFRLYYTSASTDQQTIDVYVEDNYGQVKQLTFTFNNETE